MTRRYVGATAYDVGNTRIINLASPSTNTDAANKQYVDGLVEGLSYKNEVRAASTANGTLTTAFVTGQVMDGVTLATGDRILLKNQTTGSENGIRVVAASGAPARAIDADSTTDLNNATVYVLDGTVNGGLEYTQTAKSPTVDTTALIWALKGSGSAPTSGSGAISVAGSAVSFVPKAGGFLAQDGTGAYLDTTAAAAKLVTKYSANIGDGSTTALTVTHNLGTKDRLGEPLLQVVSTGETVEADIVLGTNADTVTFGTAPTAGQYRYSTSA